MCKTWESNEKVDNVNHCVLDCPSYFVEEVDDDENTSIKRCVNECAGLSDYKNYLDLKN